MELAGALALATAGLAASVSAGGAVVTAQAIAVGLSLGRRAAPRTVPLCGGAFGLGFVLAVLGKGIPTAPPGTVAGPGPDWMPFALGLAWAGLGVWALLARSALHGAAHGDDPLEPTAPGSAQAAAAVAVALIAGAMAGWTRPPHAGPVLALLSAGPAGLAAALDTQTSLGRAALVYHAGAGLAMALALALAAVLLQRVLGVLRLGWLGPVLLVGWGALGALGGYGRAAEAILKYWPLSGLG